MGKIEIPGQTITVFFVLGICLTCLVDGQRQSQRKCMGHPTKPTFDRRAADIKCANLFRESKRCARICRLEILGVIKNNQVNDNAWKSFVESSFPSMAFKDLSESLSLCSSLFVPGTNSTSSPDCADNEKFNLCVRDTIDKVCSQTAWQ